MLKNFDFSKNQQPKQTHVISIDKKWLKKTPCQKRVAKSCVMLC